MEDLKTVVAKNIIKLRTAENLTQAELGEKLNYSDKSISKWERAEAIPDVRVLKDMAEIFHVTVDYLLNSHDGDDKIEVGQWHYKYSRNMITLVAIAGIWAVALLIFVLLWILGELYWPVFVYAVPLSLVTWLILNSVWRAGNHNFYIVSALVLSVILSVYLTFLPYNWWQLLLLAIPAELIVFLSFHIKKRDGKMNS